MKKVVGIIFGLILSISLLLVFLFYGNTESLKKQLKKLDLNDVNKLMIVAHPDDETIWGGAHLLESDYLVVCITCGSNKVRVNEINKALDYSNDKLVMLGYPDKVWGKRSNWKDEKNNIKKDIERIIKYKNWDLVITHNPDGEYGHNQHILTNKIVTDVYGKKENLYYFGKYYKKNKIQQDIVGLNKMILNKKKDMLKVYESQSFIDEKFGHMYPYENFIKSVDWK